jgi:SAM-dependent methyltransferase
MKPGPTVQPTACPDCGSPEVRSLGALPDVAFFAGRRLPAPLPGGRLLHCRSCDLRFRHPLRDDYDRLYDNEAVDAWAPGALRPDQRRVLELIEQRPEARTVLDYGCYTGGFLARLPMHLQRHGVEISAAAGAVAEQRAGARVTRTLAQQPPGQRFDLIVAMDVIEHVPSPRRLLAELLARLSTGGLLVVTTGDGGHALFRLAGPRWWYCYYPEHITFISRRWLDRHVEASGGRLLSAQPFNYLDEGASASRWWSWVKYLARPAHHARKRAAQLERTGTDPGVPGIGLGRDHLLVAITR